MRSKKPFITAQLTLTATNRSGENVGEPREAWLSQSELEELVHNGHNGPAATRLRLQIASFLLDNVRGGDR